MSLVLRLRVRRIWTLLVSAGLITGAVGIVIGIAAASSVSAASLGVCGNSIALAPGDAGSCSETISDTTNGTSTPVNVTLVIGTVSFSGGGAPGSGVGSEAVLDGQSTGLRVLVKDLTTGANFPLGDVSCYTDASESRASPYPNGAYCASSSNPQTVATNVDNASFGDSFQITWSFPIAAGNPYQGAGGTIQLDSTYTGTGGSGTLGASTGPTGGQLAASTPTTGARLPETLGQLLLGAGVLSVLAGMFAYMMAQRNRSVEPPTPRQEPTN
ncbi:MAG: hypothetical protein ACRENX_06530 [Candidatus Dormibacteria bacterium]